MPRLTYSDIQLKDKIYSPNKRHIGEIRSINNMASIAGINEPIFHVKFDDYPDHYEYFGLKYILRMVIKSN